MREAAALFGHVPHLANGLAEEPFAVGAEGVGVTGAEHTQGAGPILGRGEGPPQRPPRHGGRPTFREVGVPVQPIHEPRGDERRGVEERDVRAQRRLEGRAQQRVVGAPEHEGVDVAEARDVAGHRDARDVGVFPPFLHHRREQRRGALGDLVGAELRNLGGEGARGDGARGADDPDVARAARDGGLRRGNGDAEHPAARVVPGVAPLEVPEPDARNGVARHHHERAPFFEEPLDALLGEVEDGVGVAAANDFYEEHREQMDAGARVGWDDRHNPDELSALHHAYNLRIDRGESAFQAEYQNEPVRPTLTAAGLDRELLAKRSIPLRRGIMPNAHSTLTAAIDIQERLLFWSVASWGGGYSGHLLAYGTHPEQPGDNFTAASAKRTLADVHPGGFEATLQAGLTKLVDMLLGREWPREDGTTARIEQLVVDANWGQSTQTVREFCRRHSSSAIILPSHGRGIGPTARPIHDGKKKPGERIGPGWKIGTISGQRGLLYDANHWKSFLAARLNTTVGDPGALTFHQAEHHMLLDHLTSEQPIAVSARGRTVDEWKLLPGRENHFLDCAVLATVAASAAGITAVGAEMAPERERKRVEIPKPGAQRKTISTRRR